MSTLRRRGASFLVVGSAVALLAACGATASTEQDSTDGPVAVISRLGAPSPFRGTALARPIDKPDVTLTSTSGEQFSLAKDTAGKIVVLYVGFTHCPDVCPTTMADTAVALKQLPKPVRNDVEVVFVTADPRRDTVSRLQSWLGFFSADIVGLTGPWDKVEQVAHGVGIPIEKPVKAPDGAWVVEHGAEVLLFGKDGKAHEILTSGFPPADLANDLKLLSEGKQPA
ncbi:MAG: SCO family protein [Candidatus Nanopelagicales bacterium]